MTLNWTSFFLENNVIIKGKIKYARIVAIWILLTFCSKCSPNGALIKEIGMANRPYSSLEGPTLKLRGLLLCKVDCIVKTELWSQVIFLSVYVFQGFNKQKAYIAAQGMCYYCVFLWWNFRYILVESSQKLAFIHLFIWLFIHDVNLFCSTTY